MLDQKELEREIKESIATKVEAALSGVDIATIVSRTVDMVVAERVSSIVTSHLNNLVQKGKLEKELDNKYQQDLLALVTQEVKQRTTFEIARIDMPSAIGKQIVETVSDRLKIAALPEKFINHKNVNFDGFKLSADNITAGTIESLTSTGIQDVADKIELTVANDVVVVENNLVSRKMEVKESLVASNLAVGNLKINDQLILNEGINKQFTSLIKDIIAKETIGKTLDITRNPIMAGDKEALTENTLGPSIINSNLRKLGRLMELNVAGVAYFNDTMIVTNQGKVGINTVEPEGVLTLWDDDSELTIRRHKKKNMYIGTMRDTTLSLGVAGDTKLEIFKDGTVAMDSINVGGIRISVSDKIPTAPGAPGEIVIMSNAKENEPWAYRCLGQARWHSLR